MKTLALAAFLLVLSTASNAAAELQLSIQDGKVSIDARDVTVRQILAEWARIGKTKIVNVERLTGSPITLKLEAVPEKQALEIVLRAVPGYVAAPRETFESNASVYSTILIMATTTPVAALRPTSAPAASGVGPGMFGGVQSTPNATQLRPQPPPFPAGFIPEPQDSPSNQQIDDAALAAAAAAGLIPVPALTPTPPGVTLPLQLPGMPGTTPQQPAGGAGGAAPAPSIQWSAPPGTAQPSLAVPPATATQPAQQIPLPRLPQADR